jgi:hypothetical protein
VKLKKQGFTPELLVDYVNQKSLTSGLTADDMVKWKKEGMPQDVIQAAMKRAPRSAVSAPCAPVPSSALS